MTCCLLALLFLDLTHRPVVCFNPARLNIMILRAGQALGYGRLPVSATVTNLGSASKRGGPVATLTNLGKGAAQWLKTVGLLRVAKVVGKATLMAGVNLGMNMGTMAAAAEIVKASNPGWMTSDSHSMDGTREIHHAASWSPLPDLQASVPSSWIPCQHQRMAHTTDPAQIFP